MIRLLIVEDSALMRRNLTAFFQDEGDFEIRVARNGVEAVRENREFAPDVVTMDVTMPDMDGLTALSIIMTERPVPVVMVSSLTEKGALATYEALNLGAVDYVPKPDGTISVGIQTVRDEIVKRVRNAARARLKVPAGCGPLPEPDDARLTARLLQKTAVPSRARAPARHARLVLIGVSTGGPRTLENILPLLPADFPWPILVAQHMPASFTRLFAERMNTLCALNVVEVTHPMPVEPRTIYIAMGGSDLVLGVRAGTLTAIPRPENPRYPWHPSVEALGESALQHCLPQNIVGVILTGMGDDGSKHFSEIKFRGGRTIAEAEESAVIFGMPSELIARNGATVVLRAEEVASQLQAWAAN